MLFASVKGRRKSPGLIKQIKGYKKQKDSKTKKYKLFAIASSALTLGLTDKILEPIGEKYAKKELKNEKARKALSRASNAEIKIRIKMEELKEKQGVQQQSNTTNKIEKVLTEVTKEDLRNRLKEVFENKTSKSAIKELVTAKFKNGSIPIDGKQVKDIMESLGLKTGKKFIEKFERTGIKDVEGVSKYIYNSIQASKRNRDKLSGFSGVLEQAEILRDANLEIKGILGKPIFKDIDAVIDSIVNI